MKDNNHAVLLRANAGVTPHREHSPALYLTSSFTFTSAAQAADYFAQSGADYIYSRFSNPTVNTLNQRFALLEGAEAALSTSSGMAALTAVLLSNCRQGDRILCSKGVFGATQQLLSVHMAKFGLHTDYLATTDLDSWRAAAKEEAALLLLETPANPMQSVFDLAGLAQIARDCGALLVVDNCFCAGLQRPLEWGASLVVHSATKYPDGQGRVLGGSIAGAKTLLLENIYPFLRAAGPALSPFNAWVISNSLETLPLRVRAHSASALQLAEWLEQQTPIAQVLHTALPSHPQHDLAMRQQSGLGGGLITVRFKGGKAAAWKFIDALQCFSITANFGDSKSIVTHPASTTHQRMSKEDKAAIGLGDEVVRLSIGLEPVDVLLADLQQALAKK